MPLTLPGQALAFQQEGSDRVCVCTFGDGTANRYLVQSSVANLDNVVSLRIGLLMSTANQVASATDTRTYNVIGTSIGPINDKRVRRMYTTTIALRNRAP